jgi:hypothetical protein
MPSVRNGAQASENARKNSFSNYKSAALPTELCRRSRGAHLPRPALQTSCRSPFLLAAGLYPRYIFIVMTAEALREQLHEQAFRGFGLRMPDGRLLPVPQKKVLQ